jgi:hypothetical protein
VSAAIIFSFLLSEIFISRGIEEVVSEVDPKKSCLKVDGFETDVKLKRHLIKIINVDNLNLNICF